MLQKCVFGAFHYALNATGFLAVLGRSETVGEYSDYFATLDRKNQIYMKRMSAARLPLDFPSTGMAAPMGTAIEPAAESRSRWRPHPTKRIAS